MLERIAKHLQDKSVAAVVFSALAVGAIGSAHGQESVKTYKGQDPIVGTWLVTVAAEDIVLVTTQTAGALVFGVITAPITWVALTPRDTALLVLLGVVAMIAHVCVNRALKLAPASVVVPYPYSTLFWAILLVYMFFGDVPSPAMLTGAAIIIAAGIYIFIREQTRAKPVTFAEPP